MTSPLKSNLFTDSKPQSLSVKDWIIRKLAPKMLLSEKTIEAVVNHQFQEANQALLKNKSLEISGFGKFLFNEGKAKRQMEKYESQKAAFEKVLEDTTLSEQRRRSVQLKLQIANDGITDLKPRIYDITDIRGMEEQSSPLREVEGSDKEDEQGKDSHM
jgi:nucleoid DNA-binding protein